MKKKYMQPNVSVSLAVEKSQLLAGTGVNFGPGEHGGACSKENDFSSWDYGFDEEDNSESNSRRKSLWD